MGLGIFGASKVERGRELILFLGFYLANFGLLNVFLMEKAKVSNGGLTEATPSGSSDNF